MSFILEYREWDGGCFQEDEIDEEIICEEKEEDDEDCDDRDFEG